MNLFSIDNFQIDNFQFNCIKNVKNEYIDIHTSTKKYDYYTDNVNNVDNINTNYFLLFETCFDSAFGHWVYESAIFLPLYKKIKEQFHDKKIKILVKKNPARKYKKLFFDALDITEEDIYYIDNKIINSDNVCYDIIPINNYCITSVNYCLTNKTYSNDDMNKYKSLLLNFKTHVLSNINFDSNKKIQNLFLPRNKVENYVPNDRKINYVKIYKILETKQYIEYDTAETNKLCDQIQLVLSSENIYLDYGSSFYVNGFFCKNSTIYVINYDNNQFVTYPLFYLIYKIMIEEKNNIIHM